MKFCKVGRQGQAGMLKARTQNAKSELQKASKPGWKHSSGDAGQRGPLLAAALRETMINEKHSEKVMRRQPAQHRCLCLLPTTINPNCSFYM